MDPIDLTAALGEAQRGDRWEMTRLFRALQPSLLRYLRHHAPDVAEDLAAECWMALAQVLATFEGDGDDLRAWLFGVARHQVANHYRTRCRRLRLASAAEATVPPVPVDPADAVTDAMSAQDAVDALAHALPSDQAEIVLLRVVAGLSADQVATILDKSPGAVRVAQHRALRRLAEIWQKAPVTG